MPFILSCWLFMQIRTPVTNPPDGIVKVRRLSSVPSLLLLSSHSAKRRLAPSLPVAILRYLARRKHGSSDRCASYTPYKALSYVEDSSIVLFCAVCLPI